MKPDIHNEFLGRRSSRSPNFQTIIQYVRDSEPFVSWPRSIHHASAARQTANAGTAADAAPAGFTPREALATVAGNYATCQQYKARVDAFQAWVTQTNADIVAENAKAKQ